MNIQAEIKKIQIPHLLLIAGNGRNVGKTTLACKIIAQFARETEVIGLKITPHFHPVNEADVVYKTDNFVIVNNDGQNFDFDINRLDFCNRQIIIKN